MLLSRKQSCRRGQIRRDDVRNVVADTVSIYCAAVGYAAIPGVPLVFGSGAAALLCGGELLFPGSIVPIGPVDVSLHCNLPIRHAIACFRQAIVEELATWIAVPVEWRHTGESGFSYRRRA